jgi:hypothetical protein
MRISVSRPIAAPLALALVAAALLWFFDHLYGQKDVQMTRVGGRMNNCTCSQRIEK